MIKSLQKIRSIWWSITGGGSIIKTLIFNLILFPFPIAIKMPICFGWHVEIRGLKRGRIRLKTDSKIIRHTIKIGIPYRPIASTKGLWVLIRLQPNSTIEFSNNNTISCGCTLSVYSNACLTFNEDIFINQSTKIYCMNKVSIGAHTRMGWENQIYDSGFHFIYNENKKAIANPLGEISIGRNCWITNRCTISGSATLPPFSILAANSVLNKDMSHITTKGNLFAGSPAEIKATGLYRIVNEDFQVQLFHFFREHKDMKKYSVNNDFDLEKYLSSY